MEYLSFPILLIFLLFVFMLPKFQKTSKSRHSTSNLPPGPWKLPLIGNMHLLVGFLPHHCLRDFAKKFGPLMHLKLGEVPHIVISSPETAKEVLRTHDIRSIREEEVSKLVRFISSNTRSPINFTKMLYSLSNDITARAAFGGRCKDQEAFTQVTQKLVELAAGFTLADVFPSIKLLEVLSGLKSELEKQRREADKIHDNIINEHRASKTGMDEEEDLVHVLLNLMDDGDLEVPLTTDNIKAVILDTFMAGTETSSSTLEWAISEMLKNPRVMEKAQAEVRHIFDKKGNVDEAGLHELEYLKLVIKEILRLHPPAPLLLPRECRESCKINGYNIPVGSRIIVNTWAIGRDSSSWNEAESFYPERFLDSSIDYKGANFEFIPFGAGTRICPGLSFGIANVEFPLAHLLYHFNWQLPNGINNKDLVMTESFGATVRRKHDLYLVPSAS